MESTQNFEPLPKEVYGELPSNRSWTTTGEPLGEMIDRTLRHAWGPRPPRIDALLRAGCGAAAELQILYPSLELFWPSHLGDVVIVLDSGEEHTPEVWKPPHIHKSKLSWRFVFEHLPCTMPVGKGLGQAQNIPGRLFNQVSYLHFDRISTAEYLVTFDSDCILHSPVTPDILFDASGRLLLAKTTTFQHLSWSAQVDFFTTPHKAGSHTMVTQPVPFHRATLRAYREFLRDNVEKRTASHLRRHHYRHPNASVCLMDEVARFRALLTWRNMWLRFCWMCQLGTFLERKAGDDTSAAYNLVDLDDHESFQYQRLAMHITYEADPQNGYLRDSLQVVYEGLCRVLGSASIPSHLCSRANTSYVDAVTFGYGGRMPYSWGTQPSWKAQKAAEKLSSYMERFRQAELASRHSHDTSPRGEASRRTRKEHAMASRDKL